MGNTIRTRDPNYLQGAVGPSMYIKTQRKNSYPHPLPSCPMRKIACNDEIKPSNRSNHFMEKDCSLQVMTKR
jgi:hypothetical protein